MTPRTATARHPEPLGAPADDQQRLTWQVFLLMVVAACAVFAASAAPAVHLTVVIAVYGSTTLLLGAAWRRERRLAGHGDPLVGLAFLALLLYTVGTAGFAGVPIVLGVALPVPSVVDGLFFASYGLFGVLLWRLGSRSQVEGRRHYLDPLIVALGALPVVWVRLVEPQLVGGPVTAEQVVYLAYPVAVTALLGLTIRLAFRAHRSTVPYLLLGGWIMLELVADLILLNASVGGTYLYGQPWQALWPLSIGCLGTLVLHPGARDMLRVRQTPPVRGRTRLYVMGAALTGPMATLAIADDTSERADRFCLVVGLVLIIAVCLRLSGLMVDIAEQRRVQGELRRLSESLSHLSQHDPLTGLANRTLLSTRLAEAVASGAPTSVLLLDIDDFKLVNDSLGHAAGDLLLIEVARRLGLEIRAGDEAGRLGGDEFVVILARADAERAQAVAERLLVSAAEPLLLDGIEVSVSVSIGAATSSSTSAGLDLLGAADMAMYAAKQRGKAAVAAFEPHMHAVADERLTMEVDLRRTLRAEELFLTYQPIVDLRTGALAGVEALVRWRDAARGLVSPEVFIPIAERTGLIHPLGTWVLRESVAQLQRWDLQAPGSDVVMNVNVSTRQLERPGLLAVVDELIAGGLDPSRLVLEITETALTVDGEAASTTLFELRARGVRLAVDDFGTGYSSLSRLQAAPVAQLKIDRSFVNEIQTASSLVPIIHATVAMADGLGLGVIAEGVETEEQLQYLRRLGCGHAQGYLLARPQDAGGISELLAVPLPWAALLAARVEQLERRRSGSRRLADGVAAGDDGSTELEVTQPGLQPGQVVRAAEAIAAAAAAEVAADAASTAQAAVVAACAAALHAAEKAERVAAQAADTAARAASRLLTAAGDRPGPAASATGEAEPVRPDVVLAAGSAPAASTTRAAAAAASAVLKVAAGVEVAAAVAAAASAEAAGLLELQLAEEASTAAATICAATHRRPG
jgi:diguanylate cyclase (GGDEF)-like protein